MKVRSTFEKGLSTEFAKIKQPEGTYPHAQNIVRDAQGTVHSEPGTTLLNSLTDLTNPTVIGQTTVEDEIFYFVVSAEGSTILKLTADNNIQKILHTGTAALESVVEDRYILSVWNAAPDDKELRVLESGSSAILMDFTLNTETNQVTIDFQQFASSSVYSLLNNEVAAIDKLPFSLLPKTSIFIPVNNTQTSGDWGIIIDRTVGNTEESLKFGPFPGGSFGNRSVSFTDNDPYVYDAEGIPFNSIPADLLQFNTSNLIDVVGRKDASGNVILYFTDGVNPPRRIDTSEYIDAQNFDSATTLFLTPSLPRVTNLEVLEGGGLGTGLYKFAARLGTATGNTTTFSQISDPIPIVNEVQSAGEVAYDGAPPQTPSGKSVRVSVDNIDTSFDFLEIAVITYEGVENITKAYTIAKRAITNSSVTFDYSSADQHIEELLLETIIADSIEYTTAQHIMQKDNHLFFSNMKVKDNTTVDDAMQEIANNIEMHWFNYGTTVVNPIYNCEVEDINGNVSDWSTSGDYITNGQTNSFTFRLKSNTEGNFADYKNPDMTYRRKGYQRDEVYSFAIVPIFKGGIYGAAYHIPGDSTNLSTPNTPADDTGTRLRGWLNDDGTIHHRMPSVSTNRPFIVDTIFGNHFLYVMGVEAKNVDIESNTELAAQLEGYVIVRQRRNKVGNGIVTTQGITRTFNTTDGDGIYPGAFLGKFGVQRQDSNGQTEQSGPGYSYDTANKYFLFHSPDQEHGVVGEDYLAATTEIQQVALRGVSRRCDNRTSLMATTNPSIGALYQEYRDYTLGGGTDTSKIRVPQTLDSSVKIPISGFDVDAVNSITLPDGERIQTQGILGGVVMATATGKIHKEYLKFGDSAGYVNTYSVIPGDNHRYEIFSNFEIMEIYNLYNYSGNVYGNLETAEYIKAEEVYFDEGRGTDIQFFGGDTFLSNYMFTLGDRMIKPANRSVGLAFRTNVNAYIETRGNYEYRHWVEPEQVGDTTITGTIPYFPKYAQLMNVDPATTGSSGIWDYGMTSGPPVQYNKHYNFENTLNKYFPVDSFLNVVSEFPNRIVYSLQSFENEQFDSYRVFLTNNYHDVPKETGPISNMFEYNNGLYVHTPHSLWKSYVNEKTFTNTSTGDIVLGNGGLFPIPSQQLYTQDGGFAGSSSKYASFNTPFGRIFIDDHQKKVFLLGVKGELNEISDPVLQTYFEDKLVLTRALSYRGGYDPIWKRFFLSFQPYDGIDKGDSISYSFENRSWSSFHDHGVEFFSSRDNKLIGTLNGEFHEVSTGDSNELYSQSLNTQLQIVVNENYAMTKDFINLKWIQEYKDKVFDTIQIATEGYDTGIILPDIVTSFAEEQNFLPLGQQHVHSIGGEFRMTIPPDNKPGEQYVDDLFRPTIKGKYATIDVSFLPEISLKRPLQLQHIETEYLNVAE